MSDREAELKRLAAYVVDLHQWTRDEDQADQIAAECIRIWHGEGVCKTAWFKGDQVIYSAGVPPQLLEAPQK